MLFDKPFVNSLLTVKLATLLILCDNDTKKEWACHVTPVSV